MAQPVAYIWDTVPGWTCNGLEEGTERDPEGPGHTRNRAIDGVSQPTIQAYLPPPDKATGTVMVVLPGGGFQHLAIDKEGWDVARWLNELGITAMVVKYRTGGRDKRANAISAAEADARRAVQIARVRAAQWGLNPDKVGVMGFSAGGYLVASLGTGWDDGQPDADDPVARVSSRPDFLVPVYPAIRETHLANISELTPPAFIVQACDDFLPVEASVSFFQGLRAAKVPVEMHLYEKGGHGFGLGVKGGPVASWPALFAQWVKTV